MVQTRSQLAAASKTVTAVAAPSRKQPTEKKKEKKQKKIIYRGFVISGEKYRAKVDTFYRQLEAQLNEKSALTIFWLNMPAITIKPEEIPVEAIQLMLQKLLDNEPMWEKLAKTIKECVAPFEPFLMQTDVQQKIKEGQVKFSFGPKGEVDLTPLKEFSYWIRLIQRLFCSVQFRLLQKCEKADTKLEKALIAKDIFTYSVSCHRLISNKYTFCGMRFFATQVRKLIEFFDQGLEFCLYTFGIYHPEMVTVNCYPFIKQSELYDHPELAINDEDPCFGEAKMKFQRFY